MNKSFHLNKRKELSKFLLSDSLLILFAGDNIRKTADEHFKFVPNRNFYYLTGLKRDEYIYVMKKIGKKYEEQIFIPRNDPNIEKWIGRKLSKEEITEISGVKNVYYLEDYDSYIVNQINNYNQEIFYFDLERFSWKEQTSKSQNYANELRHKFPNITIKNIYNKISEMRQIKSEIEIDCIKKAIKITKEAIEHMISNMKPNMKENEIEAYFDFYVKKSNSTGNAFHTIAASGENAAVLHYNDNCDIAKDGDLILFDLGAQYEYYSSDISRTFPINGKFTKRQKELYNIVLKTMKLVESKTKPGITLKELNDIAKNNLAKECKKIGLIKKLEEITNYYYHGVAHFMGLDTHDVGDRSIKLKPGMVITNEPGLYIKEEKIGIRIEDDLLVTENGCENLSKDIIKETKDIEEFMKKQK